MQKYVNGKLVNLTAQEIAQRELDAQQAAQKPVLPGKALAEFLRSSFKTGSFAERTQLLSAVDPALRVLEGDEAIDAQEFEEAIATFKTLIASSMTDIQKDAIEQACRDFVTANYSFNV